MRYIVLTTYGQENVLGYIDDRQPKVCGILHASPLRGAVLKDTDGWTFLPTLSDGSIDTAKFRAATATDFEAFGVCYPN